ncbi:multidrug effflux MFS transporter [Steroidobacter sp.]|uniref:multidrug effflux MFS transporter n=1 Tax=Steroidobacter sp. TaxID=1978227 RepID=UPI002AC36D4E|nr:multidrug effflux MFS transporter [Steroidobacter sp.]
MMLIGAMTAVGPVSIDMYLPGFPAIEQEFGTRGVEGTMAAFIVGIAIGQLFYGPISDRFGRKPPLYVGLTVYMIGALGCALSVNMTMLTVMRVVQALGCCAGLVIGRAVVRDRCEPHEAARAFTTLTLIVALGPVLAPAVGGLIVGSVGWRGTFVVQALLGLALLLTMHRTLTESNVTRDATVRFGDVLRNYARLLRDRQFMALSLLLGFSMGSMFCYVTGAPRVLTQNYGLSAEQFGGLIGLNGLAFMTASMLNMRALRNMTPSQVLARYIWASPVLGVALFTLSWLFDLPIWTVVALQLLFFVCVGRVGPNVSALTLAPHGRNAGTASALMGATQSALTAAAGLAVAVFNDGTVHTLAAIMASGALLALFCFLWVRSSPPASLPA